MSRYDATFTADDPFPDQQTSRGPDPLLDGMTRAYGSAFATYAREELGFKTEMTYVLLANDIAGKWDWGEGGGRASASVSEDIRELLALDPAFRLMIAHGYSDMVTPYAVSQYVLDHLPRDRRSDARGAAQLSRRPHVLYRRQLPPRIQHRCQGILRRRAMTAGERSRHHARRTGPVHPGPQEPTFWMRWSTMASSPTMRSRAQFRQVCRMLGAIYPL